MLSIQPTKIQSYSKISNERNNINFKGLAHKPVRSQVINNVKKVSIFTCLTAISTKLLKFFSTENDSIKTYDKTTEAKFLEHFLSDMSERSFDNCSQEDIEAFDFCNKLLRDIEDD